jgi:predicted branched-subunit amino acid permease
MVMAVLIFYCLRNISFTTSPYGLAEIVSIIFIVLLIGQLKKTKNPLPPIIGGVCSIIAFFVFGPDNMLITALALGIAFLMIFQKPLEKISNPKTEGEIDA